MGHPLNSIATTDSRSRRQLFGLNLIRAVAIVMVMVDHSMRADISPDIRYLVHLIFNPDAVLFFMVSGALLLPVTGGYADFVRRRVVRAFVPFVVWVLVYAVAYYLLGMVNGYSLAMQIRWSWMSYNFDAGWFVPALMAVYFIMPLLSPWVATASRRHFHYVLLLWAASGLLPLFGALGGIRTAETPLSLFASAVPYALIGYYLTRYRYRGALLPSFVVLASADSSLSRRKARWVRLATLYTLMLSVGVVVPYALRDAANTFDMRMLSMDWTGLPAIAMAVFWFSLLVRVRSVGAVADRVVNFIARYSYGIYLSHWLLGGLLLPRYMPEWSESTAMVFAVSMGGGLAVSFVLRNIPFLGRYLV